MKRSKARVIPSSVVVRRLTKYLAYVQSISNEHGDQWVSSQELADGLSLTSSTVRQDLSHIDFCGISKRGYHVQGLQHVLEDTLGADTVWRVVVVGAGNLGKAIALNDEFRERGFCIIGVFDNDAGKIGQRVGELEIQGMRALPPFIGENKIDIGIVAVPGAAAQSVADLLIASGIRGLLNLALSHIISPRHVQLIDSRLTGSLLELSHRIKYSSLSVRRRTKKAGKVRG